MRAFEFTRIQYQSGDWDTDVRMPNNILHSIVEYTKIPIIEKEKQLFLTDKNLFKSPFCYLSGHKLVQFSSLESQALKTYISNGGFLFIDDCNHDIDGLFAKSVEQEIARIFGPKALVKIPNTHDIYKSFFVFDGPPTTSFELNGWGDDLVHDYLKAVIVNGRICILYSNKDYGCEWDYDFRNKRWLAEDNTKFGINIITYALSH